MKDYDHEHEKDVDCVMGSCMMIKKDYFQKIGGFSPQYFMYFEDVDLCYKVKSYGKRVVYSPNYEIIHLHRQESTKSLNKLSFVHFISMIKFYLFKRYN
ncbi:N-acetylglucosaminyl-diphospho-decaprenol L-rhamnosyltransferase [compost metagenome]